MFHIPTPDLRSSKPSTVYTPKHGSTPVPRSRKNRRMPSAVVVHLTNHWPNQPEVGSQIKLMNLEEKSGPKNASPISAMKVDDFFGVVPLKVTVWYCSMHVVLQQELIFGCLHQHKTIQVPLITGFLHVFDMFDLAQFLRAPLDSPWLMSTFQCLVACLHWSYVASCPADNNAARATFAGAPRQSPARPSLRGAMVGEQIPFKRPDLWGQPKSARGHGQTTGGQVGWLQNASTDFRWGWQNEMREIVFFEKIFPHKKRTQ